MLTTRGLFLFPLIPLAIPPAPGSFSQNPPLVAPVPPDSHELVTGATQVPSTPEERSAVLSLLERARQNADLHAAGSAAFNLRLNFSAGGNAQQTGAGEMEET